MADDNLTKSFRISDNLELAPLRNADDFILNKARFQVPPYNDLNRWSNRIIANLLYYQTNYLIVVSIMFLLIGAMHPRDMILGFFCICLAFVVFAYATSTSPDAVQFKKEHPLISLGIILVAGYFLVYMVHSIIVFLFGMALPMLLVFVHASLRLRNFQNKVANKLEAIGFTKTPVGRLLDIFGMRLEVIHFD